MKKIERKIGAFTTREILLSLAIIVIVLVLGSEIRATNSDRVRIAKEQLNHTVALLGAMEETITIKYYSDKENTEKTRVIEGPYAIWSFHKPGDEYGQAPHTAKIVAGQIIELNGIPVQETLGPRLSGPRH